MIGVEAAMFRSRATFWVEGTVSDDDENDAQRQPRSLTSERERLKTAQVLSSRKFCYVKTTFAKWSAKRRLHWN